MRSGTMTRSQAGMLGAEKTKIIQAEARRRRIQEYEKEPVRCKTCQGPIPYDGRRRQTFCSRSCSAAFNNKGVRRNGTQPPDCLNCGSRTVDSSRKFCSQECHLEYSYKQYIQSWLKGEESGVTCHGLDVSNYIRRWLKETRGLRCQICKTDKWQGHPIPLILDHIDGDGANNRPENIRLVCGNCNMLLPTFAGRNRGKGRQSRKVWDDKLMGIMRG